MTPPTIDIAAAVFIAVAVLAVFVERGLSLVFEHPWWIATGDRLKGSKEFVSFGLCYIICKNLGFDAISLVAGHPEAHTAGMLITAATIAGGTKGSAKLFVGLWDIKSNAARRAEVVSDAENVIEDRRAVTAVVVADAKEQKEKEAGP